MNDGKLRLFAGTVSAGRSAPILVLCLAGLLAIAVPLSAGSQVSATKAALATSSPNATQVGLTVLRNGGNAADAAIAISFALAVARPDAGNLGGGGALVYYDAKSGGVWTLDYRETAPTEAKRDMFAVDDPKRPPALTAAVPATVAGLEALHAKFGTRPWKELVAPAIALARDGVRVEGDLADALARADSQRNLHAIESTAAVFYPGGKALAAGEKLIQPDLATTLARIASSGARDFYDGSLATQLADATRAAGGLVSFHDLRGYRPTWRAPLRIHTADLDVYTLPPPSGGGLVLAETLNILSSYDLASSGFGTPASAHLVVEAERRAWIDRNRYASDPAVNRIPYRDLLSSDRAALWRKSIDLAKATATASLADPSASPEREQTTHFTIADAFGNVAAVTTTLSGDFGCGFLVPKLGFFLNAAMNEFSPGAGKANAAGLVEGVPNSIASGKRPASSLTPLIVMKNERPYLAAGSSGGPSIPSTMVQLLLGITVWQKSLYDAIDAPRFHHQAVPDEAWYEATRASAATVAKLNAMGHALTLRPSIGDVNAVMIREGSIAAIADPRHGGAAGGY